jgi:protein phosphatase
MKAHHEILRQAAANPEQKGMGTTATTAYIRGDQLFFAHIGDSRLYLFSENKLSQLTRDHTLVNDMYDQGEITLQERDNHNMKNVLTQALGTIQVIQPQYGEQQISVNDKLLMCSDGLYDVFSNGEIADMMRIKSPAFAIECMRRVAYQRNASDNFSVILISFSDKATPLLAITKEQNIPS